MLLQKSFKAFPSSQVIIDGVNEGRSFGQDAGIRGSLGVRGGCGRRFDCRRRHGKRYGLLMELQEGEADSGDEQ